MLGIIGDVICILYVSLIIPSVIFNDRICEWHMDRFIKQLKEKNSNA